MSLCLKNVVPAEFLGSARALTESKGGRSLRGARAVGAKIGFCGDKTMVGHRTEYKCCGMWKTQPEDAPKSGVCCEEDSCDVLLLFLKPCPFFFRPDSSQYRQR